jgi:hypothetical protein
MKLELALRQAGLICFLTPRFALHFFVLDRTFWVWGKYKGWYDGPIYEWGFGPFFLLVFIPWMTEDG